MSHRAIWEIIQLQMRIKHDNFSFSDLSGKDLLKYKLCVDECIELMTNSKTENAFDKNSDIIKWCNWSAKAWFHELYYVLWKKSPELNILINIVQPYLVPTFLTWCIIQVAIMAVLLFCFTELRKINPLWQFMLCYCISSEAELVIVTLLFNIYGNKFTNNILCRSKQFISSTLSAIPHWILAEALFNQSLTALRCTNLPPVGVLGTKIIISCSAVAIVVLNAHSLWLYSVDEYEKKCNIHTQAQVFIIGYPIYLEIIENIIPSAVILACVFILMYCMYKKISPETNQMKTPILLGINYIIFNVPSAVYWFFINSNKPDSSLKPFNELKTTTIFTFVTDFLANQSNFLLLPIVFGSNHIIRITTQTFLEKLFKRLREFIKPKSENVTTENEDKNQTEIVIPLVNNV